MHAPTGRGSPGRDAPLGCLLLLLALAAIVAVVMTAATIRSIALTSQASASIPPQLGAAGPDDPRRQQNETAFLEQLQASQLPITKQTTSLGYALCAVLSWGGTGSTDASTMIQNIAGLSDAQATTFVAAARATVCQPRW